MQDITEEDIAKEIEDYRAGKWKSLKNSEDVMATLYVRQIPDRIYKQAQKIALAHGYSLNDYMLFMLRQTVEGEKIRRQRTKVLAKIRLHRRALPTGAPDSVEILRQLREADE